MGNTFTDYEMGAIKYIDKMIGYCEVEIRKIADIKTSGTNTPRQITNGGKFLAFNKVIQKLQDHKNKITNRI